MTTAILKMLSRADRARLLKRLDELTELEALMRERGTLARPAARRPNARAGDTTTYTRLLPYQHDHDPG